MSEYGPEFDRLVAKWHVLEDLHDEVQPDRDQCGGVGGCSMMFTATRLEQDMIESLNAWREDR